MLGVVLVAAGAGIGLTADEVLGASTAPGTMLPNPGLADRDSLMAWLARGLLLLALAWVAIGVLAAGTPLIRRPGAAAARATWISSVLPWRARESTLGMLRADYALLLAVPIALLVATRAIQTSFLSWVHLVVVLAAWTVFALVVRLLIGARYSPYPIIAAVGGVVVLRCIVTLVVLSFTGPDGYWLAVMADPTGRALYITIAFALFVWVFVAAGWALTQQIGHRRAAGAVLGAIGAGLLLPALAIALIGFERALAAWNDQITMLSGGLSPILDLTTHPGIPSATSWAAALAGAALLAVGALLALPPRRRSLASRADAFMI